MSSDELKKDILINVVKLRKYYRIRRGILFKREYYVKAVDNISFTINRMEIFCLVGESGCGKTTTGKAILRLVDAEGSVYFNGIDIFKLSEAQFKPYRRRMQMIYQDPYESLNPRRRVYDLVAQGIRFHKLAESRDLEREMVIKALEDVGLIPVDYFINKYPHQLSGGQRQRVAIARSLVLKPDFIVADEPVSMLDVSTRVGILKLLDKLRRMYRMSILYITHDLATARYICDRIAIMYLGKIVEMGPAEDVLTDPIHPYTKALIAAIPEPDPDRRRGEIPIKGEVPSAINIPSGCRFHPRCIYMINKCRDEEPSLSMRRSNHYVACHVM